MWTLKERKKKTRDPTGIRNLDLLAHRILAIPSNTIPTSFKGRTSSKCSKDAAYFHKERESVLERSMVFWIKYIQGVPLATEPGISLIILTPMNILQRNRHTTNTFLFISHTTKVLLFKFRCNIFIGVRIIKEMSGSVASGTPCIYRVVEGLLFCHLLCAYSGPGSSVGIATGYGLDGPGIKSWWEARFSALVQTGPGAHPASCTMGTGFFPA